MAFKDYAVISVSGLALLVSIVTFATTYRFNRKKAARDLWQKNLELYLAHPHHVLGRPNGDTEEAKQAYRIHVSFILLALEEVMAAFGNDVGWGTVVRRHLERHGAFVREIVADKDRLSMYRSDLQKKMRAVAANVACDESAD